MIEQRQVIAYEPFGTWGDVFMRLVQKSDFEWVIEVSSYNDKGVATQERLFLTKEFGPLMVEFVQAEWANNAQCLLEFAMKYIE